MSTQTPWGGYPDPSESTSPPESHPAPGYSPPTTQPSYPPPPPTQPSFAPPPPPGYGQPAYRSQPLYPAQGQPAYPSQPLYPPPPGQPAYPSQPLYPPPAYPSQPLNAPNMYVAQPAYPGVPMEVPDQNGGLAIAGLVLGIICIPMALFGLCDTPFFALAIIFGALGLKSRQRHTMAMVGLILGIVGVALAILSVIIGAAIRANQPVY